MPRTYKRKTNRQNWAVEAMAAALSDVKKGTPYKTAARMHEVPVMALKRRAKGTNKSATGSEKVLGSRQPVFTKDQERELVAHIHDMETRMYGLTVKDILNLAFQLAEQNKLKHPFSLDKRKAGYEWLRGFRKRNPDIALRSPEATSAARARAFNKPVVDKFFSILHEIQQSKRFPPHRIYNVDETGLSTVPTRNTKTFAKTGRKQVARVTSAERGETTTAVICMSASGVFVPPMLIFKRVRMNLALMDGAPPGSVYACNLSGWMRMEVFTDWFNHFLNHVKPTEQDPVLLILDGHLSHTKNLEVIKKARDNYVTLLCLPPHCTHKLQPLDVGVMFPLSTYHNCALEKWMNNHPGRVVTIQQISTIFCEAYLNSAVPINAINGFKKCGIYPYNPEVFTETDFIAAQTTNEEKGEDEESIVPVMPSDNPESILEPVESEATTTTESNNLKLMLDPVSGVFEATAATAPSNLKLMLDPLASASDVTTTTASNNLELMLDPLSDVFEATAATAPNNLELMLDPMFAASEAHIAEPRTPLKMRINEGASCSSWFTVSPRDLLPLPKIVGKRSERKRRTTGTKILTSSPYKNELEEEKKRKEEIDLKRKQREENKNNKKFKPNKKKKQTNKTSKINKKKKLAKQDLSDTDEDAENDVECIYCNSKYSKSKSGEGWIQCCLCKNWAHDLCAGVDESNGGSYLCDLNCR